MGLRVRRPRFLLGGGIGKTMAKERRGLKGEEAHYNEIMARMSSQIDALENHIISTPSDMVQARVAIASLKLRATKTAHEMFVAELKVMLGSD
jgi:hypothetical protein